MSSSQKGQHIERHDDDYLRLLNIVETAKTTKYENVKNNDVFYYAKTKTTNILIKENQTLDPVIHQVKKRKKNNKKTTFSHTWHSRKQGISCLLWEI